MPVSYEDPEIYELSEKTMKHWDFPKPFFGRAIKMFPWPWSPFGGEMFPGINTRILSKLPVKIIWLHRDNDSRWASFVHLHKEDPLGMTLPGSPDVFRKWRDISGECVLWAARYMAGNMGKEHLVELNYEDILEDPVKEFEKIDWPFDKELAAAVVDPGRKNF